MKTIKSLELDSDIENVKYIPKDAEILSVEHVNYQYIYMNILCDDNSDCKLDRTFIVYYQNEEIPRDLRLKFIGAAFKRLDVYSTETAHVFEVLV